MAHFKITVAYDGTAFVGWQRQPSGVSIQGLLEDALVLAWVGAQPARASGPLLTIPVK